MGVQTLFPFEQRMAESIPKPGGTFDAGVMIRQPISKLLKNNRWLTDIAKCRKASYCFTSMQTLAFQGPDDGESGNN